jgi:hypothetical protein
MYNTSLHNIIKKIMKGDLAAKLFILNHFNHTPCADR